MCISVCMDVTGCWEISPFFLSTNVSMAGVLYTMVLQGFSQGPTKGGVD